MKYMKRTLFYDYSYLAIKNSSANKNKMPHQLVRRNAKVLTPKRFDQFESLTLNKQKSPGVFISYFTASPSAEILLLQKSVPISRKISRNRFR